MVLKKRLVGVGGEFIGMGERDESVCERESSWYVTDTYKIIK